MNIFSSPTQIQSIQMPKRVNENCAAITQAFHREVVMDGCCNREIGDDNQKIVPMGILVKGKTFNCMNQI